MLVFLLSAFFRAQVLRNEQSLLQSEENRLRQIPTAAPRGRDFRPQQQADRRERRRVLGRAAGAVRGHAARDARRGCAARSSSRNKAVRGRDPALPPRPNAAHGDLQDASFDVVSVLEEHRIEFPSLIIQSAPKRIYPDGEAVGAFVGYVSEINEGELASMASAGYKAGQLVGKRGLEKQYEAAAARTRRDSVRRGRCAQPLVRERARARGRHAAGRAAALHEHRPRSAGVHPHALRRHARRAAWSPWSRRRARCSRSTARRRSTPIASSAACRRPTYDSLNNDPRQPLYNKAIQGQYPPGSTFKLATAVIGAAGQLDQLRHAHAAAVHRVLLLWQPGLALLEKGRPRQPHLIDAIAQSCDVYFYQLGLRIRLTRLVAGGIRLGFDKRTGIDLPEESRPISRRASRTTSTRSTARKLDSRIETELNLAIGQGENAQTVRQHGALLHRARHRRQRADAA